jgi:Ni,Fe-hydrogenase III component G
MRKFGKRMSLEDAFGFSPALPAEGGGGALLRISVDPDLLLDLLAHWKSCGEENLPHLSGLTVSPGETSRVFLNLLLDLGGEGPLICLEADVPRDRLLPDFSQIWPHALWWQQELSVFTGARFECAGGGGVEWRLA